MKKLFLSVLLLCCCIVFTGCGGNSNSYDGADSTAYRIYISEKIINEARNSVNSSERASSSDSINDVKLFLNGIEFPGHSFDTDGNYIFTKVMFDSDAFQIVSAASNTIKLEIDSNTKPTVIIFEKINVMPSNIYVKKNSDIVNMYGDNGEIDVYYYNDIEQSGLTKVKDIKIEKLNSLTAKITLLNGLGEGLHKEFNYWRITATKTNGDSVSWTSDDNKSDISLLVTPSLSGNSKYYTITLTSKGEEKIHSHSLDNTAVRINELKLNGNDVLPSNILNKAFYNPIK